MDVIVKRTSRTVWKLSAKEEKETKRNCAKESERNTESERERQREGERERERETKRRETH